MNLILFRDEYREDGVFGRLIDEHNNQVAVTLEHSFDSNLGDGSYIPKVLSGTYTCLRHAPNRLPYETFELQNVPDFQGRPVIGILLHAGNYDRDSDGCILLGRRIAPDPETPGNQMITSSKNTFNAFMDSQKGLDSFTLVIKDKV